MDFGLNDIPASKAQRISKLQDFLWKAHQAGRISALIVDEAHKLSLEVLEEIRLLGNFESASEKFLQIALVGQSELDDVLNSADSVAIQAADCTAHDDYASVSRRSRAVHSVSLGDSGRERGAVFR